VRVDISVYALKPTIKYMAILTTARSKTITANPVIKPGREKKKVLNDNIYIKDFLSMPIVLSIANS
jgi:hypothetical protein